LDSIKTEVSARYQKNIFIADYHKEEFVADYRDSFILKNKKEYNLAYLVLSALAEESVLFKMFSRDFISKDLYKQREKTMKCEIRKIFESIKTDISDPRLKILVEGYIGNLNG